MTLGIAIRVFFEICAVGFIIWGIFNEGRLVAFEERIVAHFRRKRLRVVKSQNAKKHIA